jgi:hypothetical protein
MICLGGKNRRLPSIAKGVRLTIELLAQPLLTTPPRQPKLSVKSKDQTT